MPIDIVELLNGLSPSTTPLERESFVLIVGLMIPKANLLSTPK